ncbi:hypothetical protein BaRGS_00037588, partial [Batillaria attramentaria]
MNMANLGSSFCQTFELPDMKNYCTSAAKTHFSIYAASWTQPRLHPEKCKSNYYTPGWFCKESPRYMLIAGDRTRNRLQVHTPGQPDESVTFKAPALLHSKRRAWCNHPSVWRDDYKGLTRLLRGESATGCVTVIRKPAWASVESTLVRPIFLNVRHKLKVRAVGVQIDRGGTII